MKRILVTGATRGLGLAIAHSLLSHGFQVIASGSKNSSPLLQKLIQSHSGRLSFEPHDLEDISGIGAFVRHLTTRHGQLYGLINNAALGVDGLLATMHNSQIQRALRINLEAPLILAKYCSRSMLKAGEGGRIINISSIVAATGYSGLTAYAASKAGLEGSTRALARELGRMKITVNAVAPGFMKTDMTSLLGKQQMESIVRRSPLNSLATTDDVAAAVAYLCSPQADRVTGTVLTVDAGNRA